MLRSINKLKYCLVHFPSYLKNIPFFLMKVKDIRLQVTLTYLQYLSNIVLIVALGLGLYTQWSFTKNSAILIISLLGLLVFGISCAMQYYFNFQSIGQALLHVWLGCILGVIIFMNPKEYEYVGTQEVMNILLLGSLGLSCFWSICERMFHLVKHEAKLFSKVEVLESIGLIVASLVTGLDSIAISFLIIAMVMNLIAIRLKSFMGIVSFIVLIVISIAFFFRDIDVSVDIYGLVCFVGRHAFDPIVDLYFSGLSTLERWQSFLGQSKLVRHFTVVLIFLLNIFLAVLIGQQSFSHKEWFVVLPIYLVFTILWLCFHSIYLITMWKLMSKITECNHTYISISDERKSMNRILASKGVRHFSIISQRLICLTLFTTVILQGIGWETRSGYSLSLFLVILPIEGMTLSLFWELGDHLGGTCIGYALIAPVAGKRINTGATILSSSAIQDLSTRSTTTLNKIQQFFSFSMIENFGSDFSSSGLSMDNIETKLKSFFDRRTSDGPRYDTYILYYSGDVYETGDWALSDNNNLKLDTLLEWWTLKNAISGTRLILVLDTLNSYVWAKSIPYIKDQYVALQTFTLTKSADLEAAESLNIGKFTLDWVHFNMEADIDPEWSDKERTIRALYRVSNCWTDFTLHLPTQDDIAQHWDGNFPKVTKPLIKAVNFLETGSICCWCDCLTKCLKRTHMGWFPPKEVDTGHGFKLVRS